jgi:cytochrome c oxidase assembly protein subunit 15
MFRNTALGWFSVFVLITVLLLIFIGASVTSNQAGLSVPDWPTSYGYNMFSFPVSRWVGGIFYEHGHRVLASIVGMLTVILAVWIWVVEKRRWVKLISAWAVGAVVLQGIMGGLTVRMQLPLLVSTFHAVLGQTFMCLILSLTFSQLKECRIGESDPALGARPKAVFYSAVALLFSVYLQLIWGALMRHSESGLAVPDFPTSGGALVPTFDDRMLTYSNNMLKVFGKEPVTFSQILIHLLHRFFAFVVLALAVINYLFMKRATTLSTNLVRHGYYLFAGVLVQMFLGVMVIFSLKFHILTSTHVVIGAMILALCLCLVLRLLSLKKA